MAAMAALKQARGRAAIAGMISRINHPPPHPGIGSPSELTMPELRRLVARATGSDPSGPLSIPEGMALRISRTDADMLDADRWDVALVPVESRPA